MSRRTFCHCLAYLPLIALAIATGVCVEFDLNRNWIPFAVIPAFLLFGVGLMIRDTPAKKVQELPKPDRAAGI